MPVCAGLSRRALFQKPEACCDDRLAAARLALDRPGHVPLRRRPGRQKQEHGGIYREQFLRRGPVQEPVGASDFAGPQRGHLRLQRGAGGGQWCGGARQAVQPVLRHAELPQRLPALRILWQRLLPVQGVARRRQVVRAAVWLRRQVRGLAGIRRRVLHAGQGIRLLPGLPTGGTVPTELPGRACGTRAERPLGAQARVAAAGGALPPPPPALGHQQLVERTGLLSQGAVAEQLSMEALSAR